MFEFTIPYKYHLTWPRACDKCDCDHEGYFSCRDERYVDEEMMTWIKERTGAYYVCVPFGKFDEREPKPFKIFIADAAIAVQFKIMYALPCIKH